MEELESMWLLHPNYKQYLAAPFVLAPRARMEMKNCGSEFETGEENTPSALDSIVTKLSVAFPKWWSPEVEAGYRSAVVNDQSSSCPDASRVSYELFLSRVKSVDPCVTSMDQSFSGAARVTSDKRLTSKSSENISMKIMMAVNGDVTNCLGEHEYATDAKISDSESEASA